MKSVLLHIHKWFIFTFAVPCPVGEFSRSGLMPCYPCPQDYYQPNPGKSFCLSCPFYGTTTITGARSITDCSSKMTHIISYIIPLWELLFVSVVAWMLNITVFQWVWVFELVKLSFWGIFYANDCFGECSNLTASKFLSLGFNDISYPPICSFKYYWNKIYVSLPTWRTMVFR